MTLRRLDASKSRGSIAGRWIGNTLGTAAEIVEEVRRGGEEAVRRFAEQFGEVVRGGRCRSAG